MQFEDNEYNPTNQFGLVIHKKKITLDIMNIEPLDIQNPVVSRMLVTSSTVWTKYKYLHYRTRL